jgi:hypothetical protein
MVQVKINGGAMLIALLLSTVGCAAKRVVLVTAPNATLAPQPNSAQGSYGGVSVFLRTNAWNKDPKTLAGDLVPIEVTIQNAAVRLPTEAMLQEGISEDVVADQGRVTGFLFFHKPVGQSQGLAFNAILVDMRTGQSFGQIAVPFAVTEF